VTLVAIIVWITGLLEIIGGALALVALATSDELVVPGGRTAATVYAIIAIAFGIFVISIGAGLLRGSGLARVLVTISLVLSLGGAVYTMIAVPGQFAGGIVTGLLAILGLVLLWTGRASDFFASRS
jgi:hypothetical protein